MRTTTDRVRPGLRALIWLLVAMAAGVGIAVPAQAHATGESYVWLNVEPLQLTGRFELRFEDLRERLSLDLPLDGSQAEAEAALDAVAGSLRRYLDEHFDLQIGDAELPLSFTENRVVEVEGLGRFAHLLFASGVVEVPDTFVVRNSVLLEGDRFHRNLLLIEYDRKNDREYGEEFTALVFGPSTTEQELDLSDIRSLLRVRDFVWQGVLHIWIGIDHVLFLIALLLAAVLVQVPERRGIAPYRPVESLKSALWNIVKIITTFTVAHSITLSLAALDVISLPSRLIESIIALSIVLVVLNNLWPKLNEGNWLLIFFFGLFHGMGFASVMGELPFRMMHLVQVILAFNIGVELGQLAIVAVVFPIVFLLRRSALYRPAFLIGGSVAIGLLAVWWFVERAFAL